MAAKRAAQSRKPYPEFPLTFHAGSGQWCKKIKGKVYYFGSNAETALAKYRDECDDLFLNRVPKARRKEGESIQNMATAFLTFKQGRVDSGRLHIRTFEQYRQSCRMFAEFFGRDRAMKDLRPDDFTQYESHLSKGRGLHDLARHIRIARMLCLFAEDQGLIETKIRFGKGFKVPERSDMKRHRLATQTQQGLRMFDAADMRTLIDNAGNPLRTMILLAINGGFGATDCAMMPVSAVDLKRGWIDYPRPKTGAPRKIPLWPETSEALAAALERRKETDGGQLVFRTRDGHPYVESRYELIDPEGEDVPKNRRLVNVDRVAQAMGKLLRSVGLKRPGLGFYAIRHTFRTIADGAKDEVATNFLMGHSDDSMAERYRETGPSDDRLRAVVDYVHQWLFGETAATAKRSRKPSPKG